MLSALFLSVAIAFPKPNLTLPAVERTYMSGSVRPGMTNVIVQGKSVPVYRTGSWVTMVDLKEGENLINVTAGSASTNYLIKVAAKRPVESSAKARPQPPKKYVKLPYAKDEPRMHPAGKDPSMCTIVLDPGHGGPTDLGAISPQGHHEKTANLSLTRIVARELEKMGYRVVMTRTKDAEVKLMERGRFACEREDAVAFVSIHHNAPNYDRDPREVRYMCVYAWNPIGKALAEPICARLGKALEGDIPNNGVLHANYAVTRNPEVPSCLIEVDFISTPEGEEAIWNRERRLRLAHAIAQGIDDWRRAIPEEK